jgi:hypothetical protein
MLPGNRLLLKLWWPKRIYVSVKKKVLKMAAQSLAWKRKPNNLYVDHYHGYLLIELVNLVHHLSGCFIYGCRLMWCSWFYVHDSILHGFIFMIVCSWFYVTLFPATAEKTSRIFAVAKKTSRIYAAAEKNGWISVASNRNNWIWAET